MLVQTHTLDLITIVPCMTYIQRTHCMYQVPLDTIWPLKRRPDPASPPLVHCYHSCFCILWKSIFNTKWITVFMLTSSAISQPISQTTLRYGIFKLVTLGCNTRCKDSSSFGFLGKSICGFEVTCHVEVN